MADHVHVVGVRHHSPICAHRVRQVLAEVKPRWVLIEGPADMNPRLAELGLAHTPPLALFGFHRDDTAQRHATYWPFCATSPEWIALQDGLAAGASVRFIDLPAYVPRASMGENRYADRERRIDPMGAVAQVLGESGYDAVWDACFELPEPDGIGERFEAYFDGIREFGEVAPSDVAREAYMAEWVAWARDRGEPVVVVCGGFHAPELIRAAREDEAPASEPSIPEPPEGTEPELWLIPFDERRLDSFGGYAAGMPSPAYYRWVFEHGPESAPQHALRATAERLRDRGQPISVADTIGAWTHAQALARMRGHRVVGRVDLLDAVTSTWVKDALDAPVPWSSRQVLASGTHPVLVELIATLSGDARGALHPDTPQPPLVHHLAQELEALDLAIPVPEARTFRLSHGDPRRIALERLLLLGIAGVARESNDPDDAVVAYRLVPSNDVPATILRAAMYGPTLEAAAVAWLEARASAANGFEDLVGLLLDALRAALPQLSERALDQLDGSAREERDLGALGAGLSGLVHLLRHGELRPQDRGAVRRLSDAAVDRSLWLIEGLHGSGPAEVRRIQAVASVRDAARHAELTLGFDRIDGVFGRVAVDPEAPPDLRGACLGAQASLGGRPLDETAALAEASIAAGEPERLGDYLAGLLRTGREVLTDARGLLEGIDTRIRDMAAVDFERGLPSLRLAFGGLPTRERAGIARSVAELHGTSDLAVLKRLPASAADLASGMRIEAAARALLAEFGLEGT